MVNVNPQGLEKLKWYQFLAFISAGILIVSLIYPIPIRRKYPILISIGFLVYSLVEWSEWGWVNTEYRGGILAVRHKYSNIKTKILKFIALILIILPLVELFWGNEFIPFPEIPTLII